MVDTFSPAAARRIALAAQGFGRPRPAVVTTRRLAALVERLGLLQLDSVNVFERSHYLPVLARLGPYDRTLLDRLVFAPRGPYVEYLAHVASIIPVSTLPLWRWRMREMRARAESHDWVRAHRPLLAWLLDELRAEGPRPASAIEHEGSSARRGTWWEWSDAKRGLEHLFSWGEVTTAGRTRFERVYALPEHVLPADVLEAEVAREDAIRVLVARAARALGIGTLGDVADYYRLPVAATKAALLDLVDAGEVLPVSVRGWERRAYLHRDAHVPRRMEAAALLSPFDPVVWERDRALRMFGFSYRIEIYTPAPRRVYGYYSLPVLVGDELVGRVDLKSDRRDRVLRVQSAWREEGRADAIAERIVPLLDEARAWQGLETIEVAGRGDLADAIAAALRDLRSGSSSP